MKSDTPKIGKRFFDLAISVCLLGVLIPVFLMILVRAFLRNDWPVFYISERMKTTSTPFELIKFRTMRSTIIGEQNDGVSGKDKAHRITNFGRFMRRYRIDEIPQLFNVIRGDMSIVGPRPPLRRYTNQFPQIYGQVLRNLPGITGLATIVFHQHEARLLGQTSTAQETEETYVRRCIPRKARLDLIYQNNASVRLDVYILYLTAAKFIPLPGRRARRARGK